LNVGFYIAFGVANGLGEQGDEFVGALNAVKGASGFESHSGLLGSSPTLALIPAV
jgi:hypothetical protein